MKTFGYSRAHDIYLHTRLHKISFLRICNMYVNCSLSSSLFVIREPHAPCVLYHQLITWSFSTPFLNIHVFDHRLLIWTHHPLCHSLHCWPPPRATNARHWTPNDPRSRQPCIAILRRWNERVPSATTLGYHLLRQC